jgi:hypothetical protein
MLSYSQKTGLLSNEGVALGYGYAGRDKGLNNPDYEMVKNTGPIPVGVWEFGIWHNSAEFGPIVCYLRPVGGQNVFGRGGFMIHGDNKKMNYSASEGCIILSRNLRIKIRDSGEKQIVVTR